MNYRNKEPTGFNQVFIRAYMNELESLNYKTNLRTYPGPEAGLTGALFPYANSIKPPQ